ncbi:hypothetical protein, partial [Streptococcus pneumoniae]|uniref:hypothetical protein n=1 Tax=Streptococcus pneumoniae TaxID=1313 RepID=UPI0018B03ED3
SKDLQDHFACAEQIFAPLARKAARVFVTKGTESHTNNHEAALAKVLRGNIHDRLTVEFNGCRCAFAHHIGTSVRDYTEGTPLTVALNQELT